MKNNLAPLKSIILTETDTNRWTREDSDDFVYHCLIPSDAWELIIQENSQRTILSRGYPGSSWILLDYDNQQFAKA